MKKVIGRSHFLSPNKKFEKSKRNMQRCLQIWESDRTFGAIFPKAIVEFGDIFPELFLEKSSKIGKILILYRMFTKNKNFRKN